MLQFETLQIWLWASLTGTSGLGVWDLGPHWELDWEVNWIQTGTRLGQDLRPDWETGTRLEQDWDQTGCQTGNWTETGLRPDWDQIATRLEQDWDWTSSSSSSCLNLKPWLVARPLFSSEAADWSSHILTRWWSFREQRSLIGRETFSLSVCWKLPGFNSQNPSIALLCWFFCGCCRFLFFPVFFFSLCCFQRDSKCPGVVLTLLPYRTCPPGGQTDSGGGRGERGRGSSVSLKLLVETSVDWSKFLQENATTFPRRKTDIFVLMFFFILIFQK